MPVLHSYDLVNWHIIGKVYEKLDIHSRYNNMEAYAKGCWAPAIKYNNGIFYVYFCTPDEGLYMSTAKNPEGPWSPIFEVKRICNWEDPFPFWDDDGKAYLGHSIVGAGPIIIHEMSIDGKHLLDDGKIVYIGKIAEGTKIYKRDKYYYLIIPEGGVETGWQTVLRSTSIYGPYEKKIVLSQGATTINGPHQGSLVSLESGETWFIHFQSAGIIGRVCHLQPVVWENNWPNMGINKEPVSVYKKPIIQNNVLLNNLQTSDNFQSTKLGLQWQWNHNPVDNNWSLVKRPGYLRLTSMHATGINNARNTLTQRIIGENSTIITKLDTSNLCDGQIAGLAFLGAILNNWIAIVVHNNKKYIQVNIDNIITHGPFLDCDIIYFRTDIALSSNTFFSFSFDGKLFMPVGNNCILKNAFWKGIRIGIFTYSTIENNSGHADFEWFNYEINR